MKYDEHHITKILTSLAAGEGRVRACKIADISYETFLTWIETHSEFSESVKKAEDAGNDKIKDICKRRIIEDKSWQSAAWWLERNYPESYRNRSDHDITTGGQPVNKLEWEIVFADKDNIKDDKTSD